MEELYGAYKPHSEQANELLSIAKAYQNLAVRTDNNILKNGFLVQADNYLRSADKAAQSQKEETEIELYEYLNMAYRGQVLKAMKKLGKMDETAPDFDELKSFIMAYCYKCDGQDKKYNEEYAKIEDQQLKTQLNDN